MADDKKPTLPNPLVQIKFDRLDGSDSTGYYFFDEVSHSSEGYNPAYIGPQFIVLDETFGRCLSIPFSINTLGEITAPGLSQSKDGAFSLTLWVRCGKHPQGATLVSSEDNRTSWALRITDRLEFVWIDDGTGHDDQLHQWSRLVSPLTPDPHQWVHVAISSSADDVRMFINGTLVQKIEGTGGIHNTNQRDVIMLGYAGQIASELLALRVSYKYEKQIKQLSFFGTDDDLVLNVRTDWGPTSTDQGGFPSQAQKGGKIECIDAFTGQSLAQEIVEFQALGGFTVDQNGNYIEAGSFGIYASAGVVPASLGTGTQGQTSFWLDNLDAFDNWNYAGAVDCHDIATNGDGVWAVASDKFRILDQNSKTGAATLFQLANGEQAAPRFVNYDPYGECFFTAAGNTLTPIFYRYRRIEPIMNEQGQPANLKFDADIIAIATPSAARVLGQGETHIISVAVLTDDGFVHLVGWDLDENGHPIGQPQVKNGYFDDSNNRDDPAHLLSFDRYGQYLALGYQSSARVFDVLNDKYVSGPNYGYSEVSYISGAATALAISPMGDQLAIGEADGMVRIWDFSQMHDRVPSYACDFAGLRVYDQPLSQMDVEQVALGDLPAVQVGAVFPLDFSLHNTSQQQALFLTENAQELYLEITNIGDVPIVFPNAEELEGSDLTKGQRHVVELKFRPNTLLKPAKAKKDGKEVKGKKAEKFAKGDIKLVPLPPKEQLASGHADDTAHWDLLREDDLEKNDTLRLVHNGQDVASRTLLAGETQYIRLTNVQVNCDRGTHATRVQMTYQMRHLDGSTIMGSRLHYMRVLNMSDADMVGNINLLGDRADQMIQSLDTTTKGFNSQIETLKGALILERKLDKAEEDLNNKLYYEHGGPLNAMIVGSDVVIDDGITENTLVVRVRAQQPHPFSTSYTAIKGKRVPTISLITNDPNEADWGLLDKLDAVGGDGVTATTVSATCLNDSNWQMDHEQSSAGLIVMTNDIATSSNTFFYADIELTFICGLRDPKSSTPPRRSGQRQIGIRYQNIGISNEGIPPQGWLLVDVQRGKLQPTDTGTIAAGTISMLQGAELGFHETAGVGTVNASAPDSAIWEHGDKGGLKVSSTHNIALHPGLKPDHLKQLPDSRGFILSKGRDIADEDITAAGQEKDASKKPEKHQSTQARLDGRLTAIDGLDAGHADVTGGSLSIGGDAVISGDVQPGIDLQQPFVGNYLVPRGAILMWHGLKIPDGWSLCDGTNGTPNLQSHFIVGATGNKKKFDALTDYDLNQTGGNDETLKLDIDHMPSHNHKWHVDEGKGHRHQIREFNNVNHDSDGDTWSVTTPDPNDKEKLYTEYEKTGIKWEKALQYEGSSKEIEMRPPFHALYYIMKL